MTALAGGGFAVVWQDIQQHRDSRAKLRRERRRSGAEFLINTTTAGSQYQPVVAQIADGRLVAAWTDDNFSGADGIQNIRAQMFDLHGNKSGDELVVDLLSPGTRGYPAITALSDGRFVVGWDFDRTDGQTAGVGEYARILDPRDGPVIISDGGGDSAAVSVSENTTAVTTVAATGATALSYSIVGGADAAQCQTDGTTGALSFVAAPDFEAPADAGTDNSYVVTVRASDSAQNDDQTITVNVTDARRASDHL